MVVEFWTMGGWRPNDTPAGEFSAADQAVRAEELGYDGIVYVDSQNMTSDCYVNMTLAAHDTKTIKIGTGVTNSYTRHPSVTASAIATIQAQSGGRAYLGIGRGDSALAHIGLAPHSVGEFEQYLKRLQAYLRGDDVPFDDRDVDALGLADTPEISRIPWMQQAGPKVPVDVAATGPRVIAAAARHADRISLNVGADPDRTQWGMDVAREARSEAGLSGELPFTAYLPLVVHNDPEEAMRIGGHQVSLFARFSNMYGTVVGPASDRSRSVLGDIHDAYDMNEHARPGSAQDQAATAEFSREFGVFGPPDHCVEKLSRLIELGVDRFVLRGSPLDPANPDSAVSERFTQDVIQQLRN